MPERIPISRWDLFIIGLTIILVPMLVIEFTLDDEHQLRGWIAGLDTVICGFFLFDFGKGLRRAADKRRFLRRHWIDLLSSIPMTGWMRFGRLARLIRILRILLLFSKKFKRLMPAMKPGTLTYSMLILLGVVYCCSVLLFMLESSSNEQFGSIGDSIWYAFVTLTTVGYGDVYPASTMGRVVAGFLMMAGLGLFGIFTAAIARLLMRGSLGSIREREENTQETLHREISALREEVGRMARQLEGQNSPPASMNRETLPADQR